MSPPSKPNPEFAEQCARLDALVGAVLEGDREAYREVIQLCESKVRVILAAILPDKASVDDLAQEVFVLTYSKLPTYAPGSDFVAWIKTIARHLALNERKRWFRHGHLKDHFQAEVETCLEPVVTTFEDRFEGDVLGALRECLNRLEGQARQITEDFYFKGVSTEQLALQLARKSGWVRLVLFRARAALARCLASKGVL